MKRISREQLPGLLQKAASLPAGNPERRAILARIMLGGPIVFQRKDMQRILKMLDKSRDETHLLA